MSEAKTTAPTLAEKVEKATHQNTYLCYQCKRCSAGCPMAEHFDKLPNEVMLAIQNDDNSIMNSKTVWLCASCQTCNTRCPQSLDIPGILDYFRQETINSASVPETARFFKTFMRNARFFGRVYEAGLMGELNLREGKPLRDIGMGLNMIRRGKIRLTPDFARAPKTVSPQRPSSKAIAYYPGCSLHSTGKAFDLSFRGVVGELGGELKEIPGWVCCGTTPSHGVDAVAAVALPLKNLAIAEKMGVGKVVAPCAACFSRFQAALHHYRSDAPLSEKVDSALNENYRDAVSVENALDWLSTVDSDSIVKRVKRPLKGLKVACYYGCLLTRPPSVTGADDAENPTQMERIVRLLGGEPVDFGRKTDCCGGSLAVSHVQIAKGLTAKILIDAKRHGADIIAVACPLCQVNLDERQPEMSTSLDFTIPVLYITQLMALAFGLPRETQALEQSAINADL
ncbi:hypothetical protein FDZ71_04640 [bacterium]|nr:MAG: hypothetical protein FDZ71_04640 [bacterium]